MLLVGRGKNKPWMRSGKIHRSQGLYAGRFFGAGAWFVFTAGGLSGKLFWMICRNAFSVVWF
jgi:hypothetical protein